MTFFVEKRLFLFLRERLDWILFLVLRLNFIFLKSRKMILDGKA